MIFRYLCYPNTILGISGPALRTLVDRFWNMKSLAKTRKSESSWLPIQGAQTNFELCEGLHDQLDK